MKAFPILNYQNGENAFIYEHKGMDLRDYFAAKAMQAYITKFSNSPESLVSSASYQMADAMMKARKNDS